METSITFGRVLRFTNSVEEHVFFAVKPPPLEVLIKLAEEGADLRRNFETLSQSNKDTFGDSRLTKKVIEVAINHCICLAEKIKWPVTRPSPAVILAALQQN